MAVLETIPDPEIPVLTITDLGIVRGIADSPPRVHDQPDLHRLPGDGRDRNADPRSARQCRLRHVYIERVLFPPWTTDWITKRGRERLKAYGSPRRRVGHGRMPAVRIEGHARGQPFRFDPVQGAMALQILPGAVRALQVPLSSWKGRSPLREAAVLRSEDRVAPAVAVLVGLAHCGLIDLDAEARPFRHRQIAVDRASALPCW